MKIITIYLNNNPKSGGSYTYNINLLKILKYFDEDIYFFNLIVSEKFIVPLSFNLNNCNNITIHKFRESNFQIYFQWVFKKIGLNPLLFRKIFCYLMNDYWVLNKTKADIFIFPSQDDKSYLYNLKGNILTVIHDLMHKFYPNFPEVKGSIRNYHYRNIVKFSNHLIVDSKIGKFHVEQFYPKNGNEISVFPFIYFRNEDENISKIPELKGLKFIFYPAQFWTHKNHLTLLKTICVVKNKIPDVLLVLTGTQKNMLKVCIKFIKDNDISKNVKILGFVSESELNFLYKYSIALIFPSFFGPTNIPPLEAISLGCPVVISDIFGNREQCKDSALYFNPESIDSITVAIDSIWNDSKLRNQLIANSKKIKNVMTEKHHYFNFHSIICKL